VTDSNQNMQISQEGLGIVRLTLNRPEKYNALSLEVLQELCATLEKLCQDSEARVIILDSAGEKAFIAGADIEQMAGMGPLDFRHYSSYLNRLAKLMTSSEKVFIAAVKGVAYGGGNIMAMNCDVVFATPKSRFGQQEIDFGILGGLPRLMHLVGPRRAWDLVISGRTIDAREAEDIGLITKCVPAEEFDQTVSDYARAVAARPQTAVRLYKALKKVAEKVDLDTAYDYENDLISLCFDDSETKQLLGRFKK
jgi:enoyl-CoA hydratase/carnithine racemase